MAAAGAGPVRRVATPGDQRHTGGVAGEVLPTASARDIAGLRRFAEQRLDLATRSAAHADLGVGVITIL